MAFDEGLATRVREALEGLTVFSERKMFGGLAFMVQGNMCAGVLGDELMARVGPVQYDAMLERPGARMMDFTGRPMRGMVMVSPDALSEDSELTYWLTTCLAFCQSLPSK